jgi:ribosomal protein S18 acetylase RimI-like enzyme
MSHDISVRRANLEDAPAVAELMTGLNLAVGVGGVAMPQAVDPEYALALPADVARRMAAMQDVESVWLAERNGEPVGLMSLRLVPYLDQDVPYAEVMNLYVRPEARRLGVARLLVETAERVAAEAGATAMHILTGADNLQAQAFYRAAGYDMPNVSFEKFLTPEAARA